MAERKVMVRAAYDILVSRYLSLIFIDALGFESIPVPFYF